MGVFFKKYERKDDLEKEINAEREKIEAKYNELRSRVDEASKVLQGTATSAADYFEKKYAQRKLMDELGAFKDESDERLKVDVEKMTLAMLDDMEQEIASFGKKNGFDLILKSDSAGWGDERFQQKIFRAQVGGILQKDPALDVTEVMVAELNAAYKKNRKR